MKSLEKEWLKGNVTLGAAAKWSTDEIRLISELGYLLAEQGRNSEAIIIFEGLLALAPATVYFDTALGALWLREGNYKKAVYYLNKVIEHNESEIPSRINRGEALLNLSKFEKARRDFKFVLKLNMDEFNINNQFITRTKALLSALENKLKNNDSS